MSRRDDDIEELEKLGKELRAEVWKSLSYKTERAINEAINSIKDGTKEPEPYLFLATRYENGWGVKKDEIKAFKYYQTAADLGHPEACWKLAEAYRYGNPDWGIQKNLAKVREYAAIKVNTD